MATRPILPPATLGMLGGGQLGRMFTTAARTMGYGVVVLDPDPESPAGQLATQHLQADYADETALRELAATCAAVTTEFENVPAAALAYLAAHCVVRPGAASVQPTQNRNEEKRFLQHHGLPTAAWCPVHGADDLPAATEQAGTPALMKTAQGGYDGKGQAEVPDAASAATAFAALGEVEAILEQRVELACELSVIVCRDCNGYARSYPPAENVHVNGILHTSRVPASIESSIATRASEIAEATAHALDYVGVMGVELFVTQSGDVLVNELAPRPHNSGHYTLDAATTTQFEQQVRLLCGLPPASTKLLAPVAMVNLLGDLWAAGEPDWASVLSDPGTFLHLYGKQQPRPGRKMGHINIVGATADCALQRAQSLHAALLAASRA